MPTPQQEHIIFDSTPVALDKFFLKLKSAMEALEYNCDDGSTVTTLSLFDPNTIFLAAKRYSDDDIFVREVYPIAKVAGGDWRDLRPNEDYKSTAFLYEHSPREYTQYQTKVKLDLSLVVSYQQQLLIPNLSYQMAERLQLMIVNTITNKLIGGNDTTLFTNRDTVFTDFDIKYFMPIFTNEFNHFRIRFKVEVKNDCIDDIVTFVKDGNSCY